MWYVRNNYEMSVSVAFLKKGPKDVFGLAEAVQWELEAFSMTTC